MKALCWRGKEKVAVEHVPDPSILNPGDAIIKISLTAICGSDLHLYNGFIPTMKSGDIMGHEFMGEVVEIGSNVKKLKVGDRVVVPFPIACGHCSFCAEDQTSLCDNSNPKPMISKKLYGQAAAGIFGYSHMMGGYAGGQAEYVRVPYADVGPIVIPQHLSDEQVLFLSDILPTGYMAAENCDIKPGQAVAVWGCGPVGQFSIQSALMLGAEKVFAIDRFPERLALAASNERVVTINYEQEDVYDRLMELTHGEGPHACIDAVGLEAHGHGIDYLYDKLTQKVRMQTDRPTALRQILRACRKGGVVSSPGVYGGVVNMLPLGAIFNKGLVFKAGQTHVHRYLRPLLEKIEAQELDPGKIISHRFPLSQAAEAYQIFNDKQAECIKVVLNPAA